MNNIDLKKIIEQYPDCVNNGSKLKGIILDLYPDTPKAVINTLVLMANSGMAKEIQNTASPTEFDKSRWKQKLEDEGFAENVVCTCLNIFFYAVGLKVVCVQNDTKVDASYIVEKKIEKQILPTDLSDFEIKDGVLVKYKGTATDVVIPNCVTAIGEDAFEDCDTIKKVIIGNGVISIGNYAFQHCTNLDIHEYKKAEAMGSTEANNLISDIENIRKYRYPDKYVLTDDEQNDNGFIFIGSKLNRYTGNETLITIPSYITTINSWAFAGCASIEKVIIGQNVEIIGTAAFYGCKNLQEVVLISSKITRIPRKLFFACRQLKEIELPHSVESLDVSAFEGCSSLSNIDIPDSVKKVASKCFMRCSVLGNVVLPYTLTELEFGAFFLCPKLKTIEYSGDEFLWNKIKGTRFIHNNGNDNCRFTLPSLISDNINCKLIFKNELPPELKKQVEILKMPIEELGLKTQTYVLLRRANIQSISDIVGKSRSTLLKIRNFGTGRLNEVVEALDKYNLSLPD